MGIGFLILFEPYRLARALSFTNPWADPLGTGYQLSNALMAFGRGEWFGTGLGHSVQKLSYLPEAHTDFILAVLGEEFGFVGISIVIGLSFTIFGVLYQNWSSCTEAQLLARRLSGVWDQYYFSATDHCKCRNEYGLDANQRAYLAVY